ncbi:hypothetical protein ICW40_11645 [Actinotalea ferrariae]|uniref:hypothetical protein n=1 Tax=Actinotalea ferrariae TaxID=1386098 RepID=UPI001C8BAED6|nr:hypothetical protein [Actinotalea ferrariae]MBX9245458.1 hypothetical protein [Actinotalea ferrariae]
MTQQPNDAADDQASQQGTAQGQSTDAQDAAGSSAEDRTRLTSDPEAGTGPSLTMTDDVRGEQVSPVDAAHAVNPGGGPQIDPDEEDDVTGAGIR